MLIAAAGSVAGGLEVSRCTVNLEENWDFLFHTN